MRDPCPTSLVLSGGLALGAYQLGAVEALSREPRIRLRAIAGASIGAINGAILAGNPPESRVERLIQFWDEVATDVVPPILDPLGLTERGLVRHGRNWLNVAATRLMGRPSMFVPRRPFQHHESGVPSLYIAERSRALLARYVDFDRLNDGAIRYCCAATDIETGEAVLFDTAAGDRISVDHVLASGSLLPTFPPVVLNGRLLGDGGLTANAPFEPFIASDRIGETLPLCIVLDVFATHAPPPRTLEKAAERASDLKFGCQTRMRLAGVVRERALELRIPTMASRPGTDLLFLSYKAREDEPGIEKAFDFSRSSLEDRRVSGHRDVQCGLEALPARFGAPGLRVHTPGDADERTADARSIRAA